MPRRRRLLTPMRKKSNVNKYIVNNHHREVKEQSTPRGRLKGALLDALDPNADESDVSVDTSPIKRDRNNSPDYSRDTRDTSEDEDRLWRRLPVQRQSYVLKLFDRSVDLSQFEEDSPLYPICRAWIVNQPKANYRRFKKIRHDPPPTEESVDLPGPEGPHVKRIPDLLPEQRERDKNNLNPYLKHQNKREAPAAPSKENLLHDHIVRWTAVRKAWLHQSARVEARYDATQQLLNKINIGTL